MHRERTTHNVSVGERAVKPKPAVSYAAEKQQKEPDALVAKANEGDDLGDNVELF
jgi:hypothetical protein